MRPSNVQDRIRKTNFLPPHRISLAFAFFCVGTVFLSPHRSYAADQTNVLGRVAVWGEAPQIPLSLSNDLADVVAVKAGRAHVVALKANGQVVSWGDFQMDDDAKPISPLLPAQFNNNIVSIAAGRNYDLAIKSDGTVMRWGRVSAGPVPGLSNIIAVSGGKEEGPSMALRSDGKVFYFDDNDASRTSNVQSFLATNSCIAIDAADVAGAVVTATGVAVKFSSATGGAEILGYGPFKKVVYQESLIYGLRPDGTLVELIDEKKGDKDYVPLQAGLSGITDVDVGTVSGVLLKSDGTIKVWGMPNGGVIGTMPSAVSNNVLGISAHERCMAALLGDPVVFQAPQIVQQPANVTVNAGATATMTVIASGTPPLSYQWRKNGVSVAGQNYATLTLTNVSALDAGNYDVVVKGSGTPATSAQATLTVDGPPVITSPALAKGVALLPVNYQVTAANGNAAVAFSATGLPSGLSVNQANGQFEGFTPYGGAYEPTLVATNAYGQGSKKISLLINPCGTVLAWGDSGYYGLTNVPGDLTNAVAVAAGAFHALALRNDGSVTVWGGSQSAPAAVTNVVQIAAGEFHSLAVRGDGSVVCWNYATGTNPAGGFGEAAFPSNVANSNFVAVAGGSQHSLALRKDGTLLAWGRNDSGQTTVPTSATSNVIGIAAGGYVSAALRADGTVVQWGGTNLYNEVPAGLSNVVAVSGGGSRDRFLAIKNDGTVVSWGTDMGSLSNALNANITTMSPGGFRHSIAISSAGGSNKVVSWGATNALGEQPNAVTGIPEDVTNNPFASVIAVSAGGGASFAIMAPKAPQVAPMILKPPVNQSFRPGGGAEFFATASGSGPFSYQWYGFGSPLVGQTNPTLTLSNLPGTNRAGGIYVVVSNASGAVTSSVATLNVRWLPEDWRRQYYGASNNAGFAANGADPYRTGVANLLVFGLVGPQQNPAAANIRQLPMLQVDRSSLSYTFTRPAGVDGIIYGAEWTTNIVSGPWQPVSNTGLGDVHTFSVPMSGEQKKFLRLKVSEQ